MANNEEPCRGQYKQKEKLRKGKKLMAARDFSGQADWGLGKAHLI